jgi:FkbM family methyltransferase
MFHAGSHPRERGHLRNRPLSCKPYYNEALWGKQMTLIQNVARAAKRFYARKVQQPRRIREWLEKDKPFVHKSASGFMFHLNPSAFMDIFIYIDGISDRKFLEFIKAYFSSRQAKIMLDVGSNIGNHAIYLSGTFHRIHCFEPNPRAVSKLQKNIQLNRLENIIVHPVGLSNQMANLPFVDLGDTNLGGSHFTAEATDDTISLPTVRGDDYISSLGLNGIDFMKVDVEGHEFEVFDGLRSTIERHRPVIAFEHLEHVDGTTASAIAAAMPNYIFAEPFYPYPDLPMLTKLFWRVTHSEMPDFKRLTMPERRNYENILAFPDEAAYSRAVALAEG